MSDLNPETGLHIFGFSNEMGEFTASLFEGVLTFNNDFNVYNLTPEEEALLVCLTRPIGNPIQAVELSKINPILSRCESISEVDKKLKAKLIGSPLIRNFITLEKEPTGSDKWYGVVDELTDEGIESYADSGIYKINKSNSSKSAKKRRKLPFEAIKNSDEVMHDGFSKNKKIAAAGTALVVLTIGAGAGLYAKVHKKQNS